MDPAILVMRSSHNSLALELESLLMPGWMEDAVAVGRGRNLVVIGAAVSVVVVDSEIGAELDGTSEGGEEEVDLLVH
jgi:hypothetical protein